MKGRCLKLEIENKLYLNINVKRDINLDYKILNNNNYKELKSYKNKIIDSKEWDKYKKYANEYELIHIPNKKTNSESIALYNPLSRSYFKMIEMIYEFNLLNTKDENFNSAFLAEGPGGFIEAVYNTSHKLGFKYYSYNGITLKSYSNEIPGWEKTLGLLNHKDVKLSYGYDGTGSLYNYKNIIDFVNKVGLGSCNLVTGDGGFDFSFDFNKQEQTSFKLIFCEIVTALFLQKKGGNLVCKFFDMYTFLTIKLLYFIGCFYDELYIFKPYTSRPGNAEKYVIAKGFNGIDYRYLEKLLEVINLWEDDDIYINEIFDTQIPSSFIKQIKDFNIENSKLQIKTIKYTIELLNKKKGLSEINKIVEKQVKKASEWCKKYGEPLNEKSNFISRYYIDRY
jgi:23S rRNA U2552 (ribose-2'-O)-methylase RlmE/FtsJ